MSISPFVPLGIVIACIGIILTALANRVARLVLVEREKSIQRSLDKGEIPPRSDVSDRFDLANKAALMGVILAVFGVWVSMFAQLF